jgi:hypothetical protein
MRAAVLGEPGRQRQHKVQTPPLTQADKVIGRADEATMRSNSVGWVSGLARTRN